MKQVAQKLKNGHMEILEMPCPMLGKGHILVRNRYSLISAGTEGSTVKTARSGYLTKAKEKPQQVKQVFDTLLSQGITQTYRAVMKKLDAYSPLGYSCAGIVIDVGAGVKEFSVGDLVACGGLTASHAEVVSIPVNLCVKLSPHADLKKAAYNTLGAIALQGVRQAELHLGETCAVIGMGLLGQLTGLMLRASGVRVIGIDIDPSMVEIAEKYSVDLALQRDSVGIEDRVIQFGRGIGCDAVIITAASRSLDPINFAGSISRKKGTIVVVGAVPTGFDREPNFYKKELQIKMSCSYGPGRYDPLYEEKSIDYPVAYVRWTEKRNMEAFQELILSNKIDITYLTTHTVKLENVPKVYDMMLSKSEPFIGILIEYDVTGDFPRNSSRINLRGNTEKNTGPNTVSIGFIGAGSYAQSHLLPNIPKEKDVILKGVMTSAGIGSRSVAERFNFEFCTGRDKDILEDPEVNTVFIATRHNSHAQYVLSALQAAKNVFVEKPLCLTEQELKEITDLYSILNAQQSVTPILMVGYNRRFSPLAREMKRALGQGPMAITYRINAGTIASDSWIQDPEIGGGRIIGEVCHFVDFITYLTGFLPVSVHMAAMAAPGNLNDTAILSLSYADGSIGSICYFANGDKSLPKEYVEAYCHGVTAVLDDFRTLSVYASGKKKQKKLFNQDKGQKNEVQKFLQAVKSGNSLPIPFDQIISSSLATFKAVESYATGKAIRL